MIIIRSFPLACWELRKGMGTWECGRSTSASLVRPVLKEDGVAMVTGHSLGAKPHDLFCSAPRMDGHWQQHYDTLCINVFGCTSSLREITQIKQLVTPGYTDPTCTQMSRLDEWLFWPQESILLPAPLSKEDNHTCTCTYMLQYMWTRHVHKTSAAL